MNNEMTLKDVEEYCIREGIRNVARMTGDEVKDSYFRGRTIAFLHVAACIQNGSFSQKEDTEGGADR